MVHISPSFGSSGRAGLHDSGISHILPLKRVIGFVSKSPDKGTDYEETVPFYKLWHFHHII